MYFDPLKVLLAIWNKFFISTKDTKSFGSNHLTQS